MADVCERWDVFISHASEDKESFVRPLAAALRSLGVSVWYDEFSLHLGDSLSRSIDRGLAGSAFGIVVVSPSFIAKPWPEYELRGLVAREVGRSRVIIPIWHGVSREQVLEYSPPLADKVALITDKLDAHTVAITLLSEIRPDLYAEHTRPELERLASDSAIEELQAELESVREELSEYRCPFCNASITSRMDAPTDSEERDWDVREEFECGFRRLGNDIESPCPSDSRFPKFEEYELRFRFSEDDPPGFRWQCFPMGRTAMAWKVHVMPGYGSTREAAEQEVRNNYYRLQSRGNPKF